MTDPEKLILLVEDSAEDVCLFKRALARTNLKNPVHVASDVEDAISYLQGTGTYADRSVFPLPSIVVVDLRMPNKDGFHLLEWLHDRPEFRSVNIVVVSGVSRTQEVIRAYKMGASSFLIKPIQESDLRRLVRTYPAHWSRTPCTIEAAGLAVQVEGGAESVPIVNIPSNAVVIPADSGGPVTILLESSIDLITWNAAQPGTYDTTTTNRFFRVRAVR